MRRALRRRLAASGDTGFSLVELLVAMSLFSVLIGLTAATIASQSKAGDEIHQLNDVNEEARLTLVRMSHELREAQSLDHVVLYTSDPAGHPGYTANGYATSLTFSADFNGNGVIEPEAADPEQLTYTYVPNTGGTGNGQIQLTATDGTGSPVVRPVLSAYVSDFHLELRSSKWRCDSSGDGVTTWQELDTNTNSLCSHPDNNGVLDANELAQIDSVIVSFQVFKGSHKQTYSTQINLRNVGVQ